MRMKLIRTCCNDCKPPLIAVTCRLLTCTLRVMVSKSWNCSSALWTRVKKVLRELLADIRLAGCQHFAFHEYKDKKGNIIFAGHANGSVSFQLAQLNVGEGKVPVSIVLYIDGTFLKKGIPI